MHVKNNQITEITFYNSYYVKLIIMLLLYIILAFYFIWID